MEHIVKNVGHVALIGRVSIFQSKGHDRVRKVGHGCPKSGLLGIGRVHFDLVVTIESVHKGEHRVTDNGSTSMSIFGNGNSSFGHALLRSLKSIQHLIWPFFVFTGTMLPRQVGCCIGLIKPTSRSFWISCLIWISNSGLKCRGACFTGLIPSLMLSFLVTSLESRPAFLRKSRRTCLEILVGVPEFRLSFLWSGLHLGTPVRAPRFHPQGLPRPVYPPDPWTFPWLARGPLPVHQLDYGNTNRIFIVMGFRLHRRI